jgi:hypothetical protein
MPNFIVENISLKDISRIYQEAAHNRALLVAIKGQDWEHSIGEKVWAIDRSSNVFLLYGPSLCREESSQDNYIFGYKGKAYHLVTTGLFHDRISFSSRDVGLLPEYQEMKEAVLQALQIHGRWGQIEGTLYTKSPVVEFTAEGSGQ